ncbi:hypothetical protein HDV04_003091 [Boothiomyces sp. JEL0838]|nr:hypothetical protein HDV04_003091 [Boothiomyces sp. JEL0838]
MTTIITHSGTFHADESLAVFMLKQLPEYANAKVIRTRDAEVIKGGSIVVDVGGVYDPKTSRFDHHQRGFEETFSKDYNIKLSSAGLVYKHFGKNVLSKLLNWDLAHPQLEFVYQKIYDELILMFDGVDNGVMQYPSETPCAYSDSTCISSRVARLNPAWNEPTSDDILYQRFMKAVELAGEELVAKAVAESPNSFISRKALPEPWRGVRDDELSKLTGVDGCIFIHASGFIGGAKTKEATMKLALMALEYQ